MMRILLAVFILFVSGLAFAANTNPLMRVCRLQQGQFWIVYANNQDYPLCVFNQAAIGAQALYTFKAGQGTMKAVSVYKAGRRGSCEGQGAMTITARDSEGASWSLCQFNDGSLIEKTTLQRPWGHVENQLLDQAIETPY